MELLHSNRLEKAFVHVSANVKENDNIIIYGNEIRNINSTLEGTSFEMKMDGEYYNFNSKLLGAFNANNLQVVILCALNFGFSIEDLQKYIANILQVEHRLQKIEANGKIIIDDSYNGNLEGMLSSYDLISKYDGRRVIITPGIVESSKEANVELAKKIDEIFDLVIITGKINSKILSENIIKAEKLILKDKDKIQEILSEHTTIGDLILFSNDSPTFM